MRFLLIYPPPEPFFITKTNLFYGLAPPLGLLYIAKILENQGHTVTVLDFSAEPISDHALDNMVLSADVIGMTVLSPSWKTVQGLVRHIRQQDSDIPILLGGPHCTLLPEQSLADTQATISIQGDGEQVIQGITKALSQGTNFSQVPGIVYQTPSGIRHGAPPQLIDDLNSIPFPARHLVKQYVYGREYNPHLKAGQFTSIITSRGCPYTCRFCSRGSISMRRYRQRSTENIVDELKEIQDQGYQQVQFSDDCFPTNLRQAHALFDAIIQEQLDLSFTIAASRVDLAEESLYKKMRQAGVTHIQFGLESGNQDVLDFYQKQTNVETIKKAVHLSHDNGFFTIGSFILGAPFETADHFSRTLRFAQSLPLDSVSFLPLRYMIGSPLWYQAVDEGNISKDEYLVLADKRRGLGMYTTEELLRHCLHAQRSFYGRPSFAVNLLKKSLRNNDMTYVQSYLSILFSSIKHIFVSDT